MSLSLIPSEELIDELCKRYDHIGITGIKLTNKNGEYVQLRRWNGHRYLVIAQLQMFNQMLVDQELSTHIPLEGNLDR